MFGVFNWDEGKPLHVDYPAAYAGLDPNKTYVGYDFWNNAWVRPFKGAFKADLPAASCRVIAVAPYEERPVLVSTSHHVCSPLVGVSDPAWDEAAKTLSAMSDAVAGETYELRLACPEGFLFDGIDIPGATVRVEFPGVRVAFPVATTGRIAWKARFRRMGKGS